jgi:hypothetical protein
MNHQSTTFDTRQRSVLKVCEGILLNSSDAPPRALGIVMR